MQRYGYEIHRRPWLPRGTDPWETLHAIFPSWRPRTIFDVGANIGDVTLALSRHFPSAEVHSFEPIAGTAAQLRERVLPSRRIAVHQIALGAKTETVTLQLQGESTLNSLAPVAGSPRSPHLPTETIQVVTLDAFCVEHGINHVDLLKTDTEGYELAVLAGSREMLSRRAIDVILVESALIPGEPRFVPLTTIAEVLRPVGFTLAGIFDQHGWHHRLGVDFCNALFIRTAILPP